MFEFDCDAEPAPPPESPRGDAPGFLTIVVLTVFIYLFACGVVAAFIYLSARMELESPEPPEHLHEPGFEMEPAPELAAWLKETFVLDGGLHVNPVHNHLVKVDLVAVWTNCEYVDGGMPVAAAAEIITVTGKPWARVDRVDRLCMLHGNVPQARVWVYAPGWVRMHYWRKCATGEHELCHFAHKHTKDGEPMFDDLERPVLTKRAHDFGEFVTVGERYGVDACGGKAREFVEAVLRPPLIAPASFVPSFACGACGGRL